MLEKITLIGAPNVGKTSLFNQLTGENNLVGNWDGVTTEIASCKIVYQGTSVTINDLPGCYSLIASKQMSSEERLVCDYINDNLDTTLFINLISIENIARDLYVTLQLLEQNCNVIIVLNLNDKNLTYKLYNEKYDKIASYIQHNLGVNIICCNVITGFGIDKLKKIIFEQNQYIAKQKYSSSDVFKKYIPSELLNSLKNHAEVDQFNSIGELIRFLEGDLNLYNKYKSINLNYEKLTGSDACSLITQWDLFFATKRHEFINKKFIPKFKKLYNSKVHQITDKIDQIVLHKYFGLPIFLLITYLIFLCVINISDIFQNYINDFIIKCIFNPFNNLLQTIGFSKQILLIVNEGLFIGLSTLIKFIPVLFFMYAFLFVLENSGYIVRAMFLVDKLMTSIGLSGKSLIPMIIGFGCNVPAIVGARVIEHKRDKIITILMTPFMSCSARLVTYSVFATAFFSSKQGNVIFYLYIIGIISGIFTAFLLQKFLFGSKANLLLELPNYSIPPLKMILKKSMYKVKNFLKNAALLIMTTCISIALIKSMSLSADNFLCSLFFRYFMPIFEPMGIPHDNWPAIAGLFGGLIAKEAIIGSLNALYNTNNIDLVTVISSQFGNYKAAFAYLLFVLLSFPCVSVVASISKELNIKWAIFSMAWSTFLAYTAATVYYQIATFNEHPFLSLKLLTYLFITLIISLFLMKNTMKTFNNKLINYSIIPVNIN